MSHPDNSRTDINRIFLNVSLIMVLGFVCAVCIITENAALSPESVDLIQKNGKSQTSWIHFVNNFLPDEKAGALRTATRTTKLTHVLAVRLLACVAEVRKQSDRL